MSTIRTASARSGCLSGSRVVSKTPYMAAIAPLTTTRTRSWHLPAYARERRRFSIFRWQRAWPEYGNRSIICASLRSYPCHPGQAGDGANAESQRQGHLRNDEYASPISISNSAKLCICSELQRTRSCTIHRGSGINSSCLAIKCMKRPEIAGHQAHRTDRFIYSNLASPLALVIPYD